MTRGRIADMFIQKTDNPDDRISILTSTVPGMYKIVFKPHDSSGSYSFFMNQDRVLDYMSNVLRTLSSDVEPFDYIQLMTSTAPSVIYNIGDLDDSDIRCSIMDAIRYALEACPAKNETD